MSTFQNIILTDTGLEYPLEWLDRLITVSLNPDNIDHVHVTGEHFDELISHLREEDQKLQFQIKAQIFGLTNETDIGILIRHYHTALIILMDRAIAYQDKAATCTHKMEELYNSALECLNNLLSILETQFAKYLSADERVPATYLAAKKAELLQRVKNFRIRSDLSSHTQAVLKLVLKRVNDFLTKSKHAYEVTFKVLMYKADLVNKLSEISWESVEPEGFCELDQLLIYMNFNSKAYLKLLTADLIEKIEESEGTVEKLDRLHYFYKMVKQLHPKPNTILNPGYHSLEDLLQTWLSEEIAYLEKKLSLPAEELQTESKKKSKLQIITQKIKCMLSTDQMGLIVRAMMESGMVDAGSKAELFRIVAPHLSSPYNDELSADGMRSKSYVAEARDKEISIAMLLRVIKFIEGYK